MERQATEMNDEIKVGLDLIKWISVMFFIFVKKDK
jgi:hypothetical protein